MDIQSSGGEKCFKPTRFVSKKRAESLIDPSRFHRNILRPYDIKKVDKRDRKVRRRVIEQIKKITFLFSCTFTVLQVDW